MISNLLKDAIFIVVALFCYLYLLTKVPKNKHKYGCSIVFFPSDHENEKPGQFPWITFIFHR